MVIHTLKLAIKETEIKWSSPVDVGQDRYLKGTRFAPSDTEGVCLTRNFEEIFSCGTGLYLITSRFVGVTATDEGQLVEDATPSWENIETELNLLLFVNIFQLEVLIGDDKVSYPPIKPCEAHLDVEVGVLRVPIL